MNALDILCIIFGVAMFILALYINAFWYKAYGKLNNEWYEHCTKINNAWYELILKTKELDNKED
nr:MAG TPA: Vpu protein [Caudoviricetes sp.]